MKKNNTKNNKKSNKKNYLSNFSVRDKIILGFVLFATIYCLITNARDKKKIKTEAKTVIGNVFGYEIKGHNRYSFILYGKEYRGSTGTIKRKEIGDTIKIYYYPDDPNINYCWKDYFEIIN